MANKRQRQVEVEDVLTAAIKRPSPFILLFFTGLLLLAVMAGAQTFFHAVGGHVPYDQWECIGSEECLRVVHNKSREEAPELYNKTALCTSNLTAGLDFVWTVEKSSHYTLQWGLYCQHNKPSLLIAEMNFMGAIVGTGLMGPLCDKIGRRNTSLLGVILSLTATFFSVFSPTPYYLLFLRFLQGCGQFCYYSGIFLYVHEITPRRFRVLLNGYFSCMWPIGVLLSTLIFYLVNSWAYLMALTGVCLFFATLPTLFGPDSPRYILVNLRRREEAKMCLEFLIYLNRDSYSFENRNTALTFADERREDMTGLNLIKMHPHFTKHVLVQMLCWGIIAYVYYGFGYSWHGLSDDFMTSTFYNCGFETAASLLAMPMLHFVGRQRSLFLFFIGSGVMFVLMALPIGKWGQGVLTTGDLIALSATMLNSVAFSSLMLYTFEISPTTHRGRVFGICQVVARIGSYLGTKTSGFFDSHKFVLLIVFASLSFIAGAAMLLVPETKGKYTPNVPHEVEEFARDRGEDE